jgi:hypothetical protein
VVATTDRGFAITGSSHHEAPAGDVLLLLVDSNGRQQGWHTYGSYQGDCGYDIASAPDGGYLIAGAYTTPARPGTPISSDLYIVKTGMAGELEWARNFGGPEQDYGYGIVPTAAGECVVVGGTASYGAADSDVFLVGIDELNRNE